MAVTLCELQQQMMPARILFTACCCAKVKGHCLETFSTNRSFSADVQRHVRQHPRHGKAATFFGALQSNPYDRWSLPRKFFCSKGLGRIGSMRISAIWHSTLVLYRLRFSRPYSLASKKLPGPHGAECGAASRAL